MTDYWQLEDGSGSWRLEDNSGNWLLEISGQVVVEPPQIVTGGRTKLIHHIPLRKNLQSNVNLFARLSDELPSRVTLKASLWNRFKIIIPYIVILFFLDCFL